MVCLTIASVASLSTTIPKQSGPSGDEAGLQYRPIIELHDSGPRPEKRIRARPLARAHTQESDPWDVQ